MKKNHAILSFILLFSLIGCKNTTSLSSCKNDVINDHFEMKVKEFETCINNNEQIIFVSVNDSFTKLTKDYAEVIKIIEKEFDLKPLTKENYIDYKTYGWQMTSGSTSEKEQGVFISEFLDIYENSFSN